MNTKALFFLFVIGLCALSVYFSVQSIQTSNLSIDRSRHYIVNTCEDTLNWEGDICAKYNTQKYRDKYLDK